MIEMHIEHIRQSVGVLKCGRNFREFRRVKITVNPKIFVPYIKVRKIRLLFLSLSYFSLSSLTTVLLAFLV